MNAKPILKPALIALLTVPLLAACKGKDTNTPVPPPQTTTPPAVLAPPATTTPPISPSTTTAPVSPSPTPPSTSTEQGTTPSR